MLTEIKKKEFANGVVYLLHTQDGFPVETTDTFLPYYTKFATCQKTNSLYNTDIGTRGDRWMIGVSVMSGCPVRCKFCATGKLPRWRNLSAEEIVEQVRFIINKNSISPNDSKEFKINYTRMGEPFLNIENVKDAISVISEEWPNTHHYISTIGIKGSDFGWIKNNITLQLSLHSLDADRRNELIPYNKKLKIEDLGRITTKSSLKTTLNLTLVDEADFDIIKLKKWFDPSKFFIKLSPINRNEVSDKNKLGGGIISSTNLL